MTCPNTTDPNVLWDFCPNIGAAYLYAILFLLTTITHLAQAIIYRKGYCWVIIMSGVWQTLAYGFRIASIMLPKSVAAYSAWFCLILVCLFTISLIIPQSLPLLSQYENPYLTAYQIAPLWTNAFVYMVFGRMVHNYLPTSTLFRVKAWRFGLYFVLLDIVAFLIQLFGASSASGDHVPQSRILRGLHVYMVGVGLQQLFIFFFTYLAFRFHQKLNAQNRTVCIYLPFPFSRPQCPQKIRPTQPHTSN